ncbi:hypothetical protein DSECCO2_618120 [anaerobic digester metagenome]
MDEDRDDRDGLDLPGFEVNPLVIGERPYRPDDRSPGREFPAPAGKLFVGDTLEVRVIDPCGGPLYSPLPALAAGEVAGRGIRAVLEYVHPADVGGPAEPLENFLHLSLPVRLLEEPVRRKVHCAHDGVMPAESLGCVLPLGDILKEVESSQVPVVWVTDLGGEPVDASSIDEFNLVFDDRPVRLVLERRGACDKCPGIPDKRHAVGDDIAVPDLSRPHIVFQA